jgi:hypothetical protein
MRRFIISGRHIKSDDVNFIKKTASIYKLKRIEIESFFGFVSTFYRLYGGRSFTPGYGLSFNQYKELLRNGIYFELTLTNIHYNEEMYKEVYPLLEKLDVKGNSIISSNDDLTKRIKKDFKKLSVRKSIIKGVKNIEELERALDIYDTVALSPEWNDNPDMLQAIKEKHRVSPFASIGCLYNCRSRLCYRYLSDMNAFGESKLKKGCGGQKHFKYNYVFDLNDPQFAGFKAFKLIPPWGKKPVIKKKWK